MAEYTMMTKTKNEFGFAIPHRTLLRFAEGLDSLLRTIKAELSGAGCASMSTNLPSASATRSTARRNPTDYLRDLHIHPPPAQGKSYI